MKTQDVIDFFGGTGKTGRALGITSAAVSQWGDDVPASRLKTVEMAMKLEEMARAKEAKKKRA